MKRQMIDERKMSEQTQSAPTASTAGSCPTIIQLVAYAPALVPSEPHLLTHLRDTVTYYLK